MGRLFRVLFSAGLLGDFSRSDTVGAYPGPLLKPEASTNSDPHSRGSGKRQEGRISPVRPGFPEQVPSTQDSVPH